MSRCYPYPPPFLLESEIRKKKDSEKSLFLTVKDESIKKREETKKERKKEKNEKKEKVQNIRENGEFDTKEHTQKERYKDEGSKIDHNGGNHPKRREDEEVEKSGLTEEHDQPTSLQNLGNISDSSQDSRKRKRTHIPMPTSSSNGCHNFGNVLRFRLSLTKNKDNKNQVVVLPPSSKVEKAYCCTSERPERIVQNEIDDGNPSRSLSSQLCSTSGTTLTSEILLTQLNGSEPAPMAGTNCFDESCFLDTVEDTQYRNLIENWTPPSQSLTVCCTDLDDQEWLFGSKQIAHDRHKLASSKRVKATSSVEEKAMVSSGLWPSTCYLADADIYALPYTIPY